MSIIIKKYNDFIYESRSEILHSDLDASELIEKMTPWYIFGMYGKEIYRGMKSKEDYLIIEPSKYNRSPIAQETTEEIIPTYYNNILIESTNWHKYSDIPRNKSIFCSNNFDSADFYSRKDAGSVYLVIPFEKDTEFIMSQKGDVFSSFGYMENRFGLFMPSFLIKFKKMFKLKNFKYNNLSTLRKDIENTENKLINVNENGDKITPTQSLIDFVNKIAFRRDKKEDSILRKEEIEKHGGVTGWLEMLLDPDLNQFMRVKYNRDINFDIKDMYIDGEKNHAHELWTNKKCLLIREDLLY